MLLQAVGLAKKFNGNKAVRCVDLEIQAGEVVALLGPNGAGKTTTMRMLSGCLEPDAGSVRITSYDMLRHRIKAQALIGYLPEGAPLYGEMTPHAYLRFIAESRGMNKAEAAAAIEQAVDRVQLESVLHQSVATLSKGYRRRTALAAAILHDPPILLLDEPTDGLDPNQNQTIRSLILALAPEKAILISTHNLEDVESVCTRAVLIDSGLVVADGAPKDLAARTPSRKLLDFFRATTRRGDAA